MFDILDVQGTECSIAKAATLAVHPILDHRNEEELKAFDKAALANVMISHDVSPLSNAGNVHYQLMIASSPFSNSGRKDVSQPVDGGYYVAKEPDVSLQEDEVFSDVSRDVSSSAKADGGGSGAKEGAKVHYQLLTEGAEVHYQLLTASSPSSGYRQEDVSPPTISDGDQHGAKEEGEE